MKCNRFGLRFTTAVGEKLSSWKWALNSISAFCCSLLRDISHEKFVSTAFSKKVTIKNLSLLFSGNFTERPGTLSMRDCIGKCCGDVACDLAFMFGDSCYSVECKSEKLCQAVLAKPSHLEPKISYVSRGYFEDKDKGMCCTTFLMQWFICIQFVAKMEIQLLLTIVEFWLRKPRCQKRRWKQWREIVQSGGISLRPHETSGCYDDDDDYDEFHGAKSGKSTKTAERNGDSGHRMTTLPPAHWAILHSDLALHLSLLRQHSNRIIRRICSGSI